MEDGENVSYDESALRDFGVNVVDEEEEARPFRLSDLAAEYSTDSGPQSEPETDDSRPVSRLGFSNSRIVYLDRSGGATSEDLAESTNDLVVDTLEVLGEGSRRSFRPKSSFRPVKPCTPDDGELSDRSEGSGQCNREKMRKSDECLLSRR